MQKVLREYGGVISVAAAFVFVCTVVALRGNASYWKKEAAATEKNLANLQHSHSNLKARSGLLSFRSPCV